MHKQRPYSSAFTIVELLVIIVVIGILAVLVVTGYSTMSQRAITASLQADLNGGKKQIENFYAINGVYPTANKCTNTQATEICLKPSGSNTYTYTPNETPSPTAYSLVSTRGKISYQTTSSTPCSSLTQPNIVTSGLTLNLDAGNPNSYAGSGTSWTDLSGNSNNGTLVNGPIYSCANGGSLFFSGENYVSLPQANLLFPGPAINATLEVWIKPMNDSIYVGINNPAGNRLYIGRNGGWDFGLGTCGWTGCISNGQKINTTTGNWTHASLSIEAGTARLFINGQETITKIQTSVSLSGIFTIGTYYAAGAWGGFSPNASIAIVNVYNRPLSAAEISQNFNAIRSRFGI